MVTVTIALGSKAQKSVVAAYIDTYKDIAINEMIRTGVPASITLAQGILETQAGQSDLVKQSNNHFGIKCKTEWTGAKVYHDDDARGECFRSYPSAEDSYRDHSDFLKNRPNYAFLFQLNPTDYEGWAKGLKKAGYATSNVYAQMLIKIIVDNNLQQYTLLAINRQRNPNQAQYASAGNSQNQTEAAIAANTPAQNRSRNREEAAPASATTVTTSNNYHTAANSNTATEQPSTVATAAPSRTINQPNNGSSNAVQVAQTAIKAPSYPTGVFEINQTKVIYANEGTSLFALANNYNLTYKKLLEFNELAEKDILENSQLIFLEKKPKKGAKDFHVSEMAETIELVSQREGVRLENLLAYNHLSRGARLQTGEKVYLRSNAPVSPKTLHDNNYQASSR